MQVMIGILHEIGFPGQNMSAFMFIHFMYVFQSLFN